MSHHTLGLVSKLSGQPIFQTEWLNEKELGKGSTKFAIFNLNNHQ